MSLSEYIEKLKIDEIEDDTSFCEEEYNAVHAYCDGKHYNLSENDMNTIVARGLEDSFNVWRNNYIIELWREFGDVTMNPETECIEEKWHGFPVGTHREVIWHWFEVAFNVSVAADLMGL